MFKWPSNELGSAQGLPEILQNHNFLPDLVREPSTHSQASGLADADLESAHVEEVANPVDLNASPDFVPGQGSPDEHEDKEVEE